MRREKENKGLLERLKAIFSFQVIMLIICVLLTFANGFLFGLGKNCPEPEFNTTTDNLTCESQILYQYIYTFPDSQLPEIKCEVCKCQN